MPSNFFDKFFETEKYQQEQAIGREQARQSRNYADLSLQQMFKENSDRTQQMQAGQDSAQAYQQMFRTMPISAVGVVGPMIASPNPDVRQQAREMLDEYQKRKNPAVIAEANYADETAAAAREKSVREAGDWANQQKLFPLQLQKSEREIELSVAQIAQTKTSAESAQFQIENAVRNQYQQLPAIKQAQMAQRYYQTGYRNLDLNSPWVCLWL